MDGAVGKFDECIYIYQCVYICKYSCIDMNTLTFIHPYHISYIQYIHINIRYT